MHISLRSGRVLSCFVIALTCIAAGGFAQDCNRVVDQWPHGPADEVFTTQRHSFFSSGTVLMVGDISDISTPVTVGSIDLEMLIGDIVVADNVAYVAGGNFIDGPGGFFQVDVSDPSDPVLMSFLATPHPARALWVTQANAFIGLADPTEPTNGTLLVVDIRDPETPREIARLPISGWPEEMTGDGDLIWLLDLGAAARAIDIEDPAFPEELAMIEGNIRDLDVDGEILYLAEWGDDRNDALRILDVTDPTAPIELGDYRATRPRKVEIFGPVAFLASAPSESSIRIELIDVTQPDDPGRRGILSIGSSGGDLLIHDLAVAARVAYLTHSQGGPVLVDALDFEEPVLAGSFSTPGVAGSLAMDNGLVALASGSTGLTFFDLAGNDAGGPVTPAGPDGLFASDVALSGNHAFVAAWRDGVRIYDVTNRAAPVEIAAVDTGQRYFRTVLSGDHLFASFYGNPYVTTAIFDVSDPTNPIQISELQGGVLAVDRGYAHADWSDWLGRCGLATWDVSNPSNPSTNPTTINFWGGCDRCEWPWPGYEKSYELDPHRQISGVAIWNNQGWVAIGQGGLVALDLTDPSSPRQLGILDVNACGVSAVAAERNTAHVATSSPSGLLVARFPADGVIETAGFVPLPGFPVGVVSSGATVFTANQTSGVSAVNVGGCRAPLRATGRRTP